MEKLTGILNATRNGVGVKFRSVTTMQTAAKELRFTRDNRRLTLQQRIFYENNGYLVFPKLVPPQTLNRCSDRFDRIVAGKESSGGMIVMYDARDRKSVNKIQDINFDDVMREYIENKELLDIVECFTGPNIMAVHSMLIAKPPDIGYGTTRHPPHQDLYYFPFRPADKIVAAWTAIEKCTPDNGCLFVAPGSHTSPLLPHSYPPGAEEGSVNKFYHGIHDALPNVKWVNLEMDPGDTVFFHPLLIHGSGINKSTGTRKAISCHYASSDCSYIKITGTVQQTIEDEVLDLIKKRLGSDEVEYADLWRFKSSLVRGIRSSL